MPGLLHSTTQSPKPFSIFPLFSLEQFRSIFWPYRGQCLLVRRFKFLQKKKKLGSELWLQWLLVWKLFVTANHGNRSKQTRRCSAFSLLNLISCTFCPNQNGSWDHQNKAISTIFVDAFVYFVCSAAVVLILCC